MRRNMSIHGDAVMLGRVTSWLAPLVEAHPTVAPGTGKTLIQTIAQQALASGEDLATALYNQLPDDVVSLRALEKMFDPSGYMGGAATSVAEINSRYRKWSR